MAREDSWIVELEIKYSQSSRNAFATNYQAYILKQQTVLEKLKIQVISD